VGTLFNVEGRLVPPEQAFVPVLDRGFLYGDSVYDVVRTYGGRVFELGRHLDRMERTASRIGIALPPRSLLESELLRTIDAAGDPESYARFIVTRGEGRFGLAPHLAEGESRLIIMVKPLEAPAPEQYERGLRMAVARIRRNPPQALDPALKTGNYLNGILALREAHAAGADDALMLDIHGQVTEASTSNVFHVKNGVVVTPPLSLGMLEGVTRGLLIEVARADGVTVREQPHGSEALVSADEVFVTSTIREVMGVTSLVLLESGVPEHRVIAGGKPGAMTRRLRAVFRRYVERTHLR
jgi:branched-chain amino acid aminotransferase